jgi:diguanylate cyclase (GGDEF)-like protein
MLNPSFVSTQTLRLTELQSHDIFCTPLESRFDRLTRLARASLRVPVAAITVRAGQRIWFKSVVGWNVRELQLSDSLTERALASNDVVVINDTHLDSTTARHPLVTGGPKFRFYAAQVLHDQHGGAVGAFEIFDLRPRTLLEQDLQNLHDLVQLARKELLTTDLQDAQVQLVNKLDAARREALMDSLTSVWNRRAADELLCKAIAGADEGQLAIAVCVVDVNNFKAINDRYGHPSGDRALQKVAQSLVSSVRDGDAVCRTGGDEFMVIMPKVGAGEAETIAERLRHTVEHASFRTRGGTIRLTVTTGIAVRRPGEQCTAKDLINAADIALYQAKQSDASPARPPGSRPARAQANGL